MVEHEIASLLLGSELQELKEKFNRMTEIFSSI